MDNKVQISTLAEYVTVITEIISKLEKPNLLNEYKLYFRGIENIGFELIPSIARHPSQFVCNSLTWYEERFVHEAKRKLPDVFKDEEYPINLLTRLQHYGIPTRLLDITSNALVALYFACLNEMNEDGEVIVFSAGIENMHPYTSPIANAISESYLFSKLTFSKLDGLISEAESHSYFNRFRQQEVEPDRSKYIELLASRFKEPIFIMPLELSERQKRQQGAFILFPNKIELNTRFEPNEYEILEGIEKMNKDTDSRIAKRIVIQNTHKSLIIRELSSFGISEDFLFPDSVDVVCKSIANNIKGLYKQNY